MRHRNPSGQGFTLIEVLVALVVFALAAVVLGAAYVNVLNSYEVAKRANQDDSDVWFARSQLLSQSDLTTAQAGAEFDDGPRHVKWTADIEQAPTTDLFAVTFTCTVTEGSAQPKVTTETLMLLRPTWSDPATQSQLRQDAASRIALVQGKVAK